MPDGHVVKDEHFLKVHCNEDIKFYYRLFYFYINDLWSWLPNLHFSAKVVKEDGHFPGDYSHSYYIQGKEEVLQDDDIRKISLQLIFGLLQHSH
jgi:hypothetical protein